MHKKAFGKVTINNNFLFDIFVVDLFIYLFFFFFGLYFSPTEMLY